MSSSSALLEMLTQAAQSLNRYRDLDELLHAAVDLCLDAVGADACFVYLYEQDDLVLRASSNAHPDEVGRLRMRIGEGITGWVAQQRRPVALSEKATADARFKFYSALPEDRFEAFLSVPILFRQRVLGVINLQHTAVYAHAAEEIKAVQALGFMLGEALERAGEAHARQQLERRLAAAAQFQRWLLRTGGGARLELCEKLAGVLGARALTLEVRREQEANSYAWTAAGEAPLAAVEAAMPAGGDAPARTGAHTWLLPLRVGEEPLGSVHAGFAASAQPDLALAALLTGMVAPLLQAETLRTQVEHQEQALAERKLIERAKGLLQQERRLSEAEAYRLLQQESRRSRRTMASVAQALLTSRDLGGESELHAPAAPGNE